LRVAAPLPGHRRPRRQRIPSHGDELPPPPPEEPEINLIPFIDVLLVVLIFLMLSTTYSVHRAAGQPAGGRRREAARPAGEIIVAVAADGRYAVNRQPVDGRSVELLAAALALRRRGEGRRWSSSRPTRWRRTSR
jgi:biopolymer transport protein ExbD